MGSQTRQTPCAALAVLLSVAVTCLPRVGAAAEADASRQREDSPAPGDDPASAAMFAVRETGVLRAGQFEVGFLVDNYDRDPLGLDIFDGVVGCRLGLGRGVELDLDYQITRSVSMPGAHPVPPPPLDIVVANGSAPAGAYRAMYWPMPFLRHYPARVDEMVPGEYTLGAKARLFRQRAWRPALSMSFSVAGPGTTARYELSKGAGSGAVDMGLHAQASWGYRRLRVAANLGVTINGRVDPGDRVIFVRERRFEDLTIRRPGFLRTGLGVGFRVARGLSLLAETSGWDPVGGHTRMQTEKGVADALAGIEVRAGGLTLALGVRQHLSPQQDGLALPTGPLAGAIDLTGASDAARGSALARLGVSDHRADANVVVVGWPRDWTLPDGARRIPDTYPTHTTGNAGYFARLSLRLGR